MCELVLLLFFALFSRFIPPSRCRSVLISRIPVHDEWNTQVAVPLTMDITITICTRFWYDNTHTQSLKRMKKATDEVKKNVMRNKNANL